MPFRSESASALRSSAFPSGPTGEKELRNTLLNSEPVLSIQAIWPSEHEFRLTNPVDLRNRSSKTEVCKDGLSPPNCPNFCGTCLHESVNRTTRRGRLSRAWV